MGRPRMHWVDDIKAISGMSLGELYMAVKGCDNCRMMTITRRRPILDGTRGEESLISIYAKYNRVQTN